MDIAQHPKNAAYPELLKGVSTFYELELKIATFATTVEKGDAFEVFVGAYLTLFYPDVPEAVHYKPFPRQVAEALGVLEAQDTGIDSVLSNAAGQTAVQAKFRAGRGTLTLSDLATFFAVSDRASNRLIVTNCSSLSEKLGDRLRTTCILADSFDALQPEDFEALRQVLAGETSPSLAPHTPHDYQNTATAATIEVLMEHGRATVLMACGTGKTIVQTELARIEAPRNLVVFVPSLPLIRQQLREWRRAGRLSGRRILVVCSDKDTANELTAEDDVLWLSKAEVGAPVTTNPKDILEFLGVQGAPCVVFSTYQSSHLLAQGVPFGFTFDLGLFDEAHKTTGYAGRLYSAALLDRNVAITKRAFFTATPRHVVEVRDDEDEVAVGVLSMEDESIYGPVSYELPFREAIAKGYICDYRVIIAVISSAGLREAAVRLGEVIVNGVSKRAQEVAAHIAINKAMTQYGIKKGIAFFGRIADTESFSDCENQQFYPPGSGVELITVNGTLPGSVRESRIAQYRNAKSGVLSNVRCLTEGLDVPATDFVAFMSPKRSTVSVTQAIGRALRKDPTDASKQFGHIVLPLFVENADGESVLDAVERSNFGEIWQIMGSLREQDSSLADTAYLINAPDTPARPDPWANFQHHVRISCDGLPVKMGDLYRGIAAKLVGDLDDGWDIYYAKLKEVLRTTGSVEIPDTHEYNYLRVWTRKQRLVFLAGRMLPLRRQALNDIDFQWSPTSPLWRAMLTRFKEFKAKHGRSDGRYVAKHSVSLRNWITGQRRSAASGFLSNEKRALLDEAGFKYSRDTEVRTVMLPEDTFKEIVKYYRAHGHCVVPSDISVGSLYSRLEWLCARARTPAGAQWLAPLVSMGAYRPKGTVEWENNFAAWRKHRAAGTPLHPDVAAWAAAQRPLLERRVDRLQVPLPERYAEYFKAEANQYGAIEYVRRMKPSAMRARLRELATGEGLADRLIASGFVQSRVAASEQSHPF